LGVALYYKTKNVEVTMLNFIKKNPILMKFSLFEIFYYFSIGIVVPFFSLILKDAGWSIEHITYFFSISAFTIFLLGPVIGKLADSVGKRKLIIIGLIMQFCFFLVYYFFIEHTKFIFFIRFLEIISYICIGLVSISAVEDLVKEDRGFWMGIILGIGTIGSLLGPILAGFIAQTFSKVSLFLFSLPLTIMALMIIFFFPEFKKKKNFSKKDLNPFSEIKHFLTFRKLQGMALLGILMNSKGQIYVIFFPILIVSNLGFSETTLGIFLAIPVFLHIFQFLFGKIADSISAEFGILFGVMINGAALFFIPYVNTFIEFSAFLFVMGFGGSIWNVSAWVLMGEIGKQENIEGEIVGTYASLAKIGVFISTLLSASLVGVLGISGTLQAFAVLILLGGMISIYFLTPIFHHKKHGSYFDRVK
jgi:DHA1 family multidrug resistance protein-like MFS transporter